MSEGLTFISIQWVKPLWQRLKKLRGARNKELQDICRVFGDPTLEAKYYVEPQCQNTNPADSREDEAVSTVRAPIFKTLNKFFNGDILSRDGASQIFILADAGMGKTTLLMMLRLADLTSFWPRGYKCLLVKLGSESLDAIRLAVNPGRTILLLDALDEDFEAIGTDSTGAGKVEKRLTELLHATRFFHRTIISCRTQFLPAMEDDPFRRNDKIKIGNFVCPYLYLSLFDDGQVNEYLAKKYPPRLRDLLLIRENPIVKKGKCIVDKMGSLRFRPLLLTYIEDFLESELVEWTPPAIYETLIDSWLRRELRKIHDILPENRSRLNKQMLYRACAKLALDMHLSGTPTIEPERLQKLVGEISKVIDKFQIESRSLLTRNSQGHYRFAHFSIQEYLIAQAICLLSAKSVTIRARATDQVWGFIRGIGELENVRHAITFEGAQLNRPNLSGLELQGVPFAKSNLRSANFSESRIFEGNFQYANLQNADFRRAVLTGANFSGAKLDGANFTGAILENAKFSEASLKAAVFKNSNLKGGNFHKANLGHVDYESAILDGADFSGSRAKSANFRKTSVKGAKLDGCDLSGADLSNADLRGTVVTRSYLRAGAMSGDDDKPVRIAGAKLDGIVVDSDEEAYLWGPAR